MLRATVDKNPTYSLAWYDLAFALRTRGQHAAAVDAYEHYIKLKPGDPDPYYGLGRSLQHLGRAGRCAAGVRDVPVARKTADRAALGRIGRGAAQDAGGGKVAPEIGPEVGASSGRSSVNVDPCPGLLSTDSVPPCATAICRPM